MKLHGLVITGFIFTLGLHLAAMAEPQTLVLSDGMASYHSRDVLSAWVGKTPEVKGSLVYDDRTGEFLTGQVQVQLASIDSGNGLRDGRMRKEFLQTDQYPAALFVVKSLTGFAKFTEWKRWGTKQKGTISGDLTIRDITRPVTFTSEAVYTGRELQLKATGTIKMTDYGITPPSLLLVTVEDAVGLEFTAVGKGPHPRLIAMGNRVSTHINGTSRPHIDRFYARKNL